MSSCQCSDCEVRRCKKVKKVKKSCRKTCQTVCEEVDPCEEECVATCVITSPICSPPICGSCGQIRCICSTSILGRQSIFLATDEPVANLDFVGVGSSGPVFVTETVVMPHNAALTDLAFDIRDAVPAAGNSAEIYVASNTAPTTPIATGIIATLPATGRFAIGSGYYLVNAGDLVSVRVFTAGGAFVSGVAATIRYVEV